METELVSFTREGIRQDTIGRTIRRIVRGVPAEVSEEAAREIKRTDAKILNELNGYHRALADMTATALAKAKEPI